MGELAVASTAGDVLACIGLGSCIGLLLLDRTTGVSALAHVMLPESPPSGTPEGSPAKFADTGVPATIEAVVHAGARRLRLEAALVGGASMFAASGGQEIGSRNAEAVLAVLHRERIPVLAVATGGSRGRTLRAVLGGRGTLPEVTVREAGGDDVPLGLDDHVALAA